MMEAERRKIIRRMQVYEHLGYYNFGLEPLEGRVDSAKSYYIQAADIAGRIARFLLETEGLFIVCCSFEYVMYNGKRISPERAFEIVEEYKKVGY